MKKIAFVSRRKLIAQGLDAALQGRPEMDMQLLPLIPPQRIRTDAGVYSPDLMVLDVEGGLEEDRLLCVCREIREQLPDCRLLLLLSEENTRGRGLAVQARQERLADDFVFYDSSVQYLLAKLAAL